MTYEDDSLMLHTDLYQVNMAETYWRDGMAENKAVFELYFRKLPFDNGYAVFAGLDRVLDFIHNFGFTESDLTYLKEIGGYDDDFLEYLRNMRFSGTIRSMKEGGSCFCQ